MKKTPEITRRQFVKGALAVSAGLAAARLLGPGAVFAEAAPEAAYDLARGTVRLLNGMEMPVFGLGTYTLMNRVAESSVYEALTAGYRLIDTAAAYGNERGVGAGVKRSGVPREDIFLTSKLWPTNVAMRDIDRRLELLETDYIDLLLLHQPYDDYIAAWRTMEQAVHQGKVRALGLSNFTASQVEEIRAVAEIPPVLLQVETHLHHQQHLGAEYLAHHGIAMESWSPLGGRPNTPLFLQDETVCAVAEERGMTPAQVIIRWHLQSGRVCIPGSGNPEHIRENIGALDFSLTDADMARLDALEQKAPYFPEMGLQEADTLAVMEGWSKGA